MEKLILSTGRTAKKLSMLQDANVRVFRDLDKNGILMSTQDLTFL
jgi:hypothetical protein